MAPVHIRILSFDTVLRPEVGQPGMSPVNLFSIDLVDLPPMDLSSPYSALQLSPSFNRNANNTVKRELSKGKMVKNLLSPPRILITTTTTTTKNNNSALTLNHSVTMIP
uniref:Uncharacterized protein n=1 Tax=Glossina palpalis gambiensis TaxID=67801 RepID=A0A1B0BCJ1_9MUSC